MQSTMRTAIRVSKMDFNLCFNPCSTMVQASLNAAFGNNYVLGIIPNLSFYKEIIYNSDKIKR